MSVRVLQFDEEFSARQEAQAELQKQEEKIKGLEAHINTLQAQVTTLIRLLYHTFFSLFSKVFLKNLWLCTSSSSPIDLPHSAVFDSLPKGIKHRLKLTEDTATCVPHDHL